MSRPSSSSPSESRKIAALQHWVDHPSSRVGSTEVGSEFGDILRDDIEKCRLRLEQNGIEPRDVLGVGTYGVVFRALDVTRQEEVAVKLLRPSVSLSSQTRSRFELEAKTMARCRLTGVVPLYDYQIGDGIPYLVMKWINGPSLREYLQRCGRPIDQTTSIKFIRDIALAVQGLHQHGIIHRDLKPSNILLEQLPATETSVSTLVAHVADFGFVKCLETELPAAYTHSNSTSVVGTVNYMSPEQACGRSDVLSIATDIYSLGVILYEMLAGRCPFAAASHVELLQAIVKEDPPRLSRQNRDVSAELEAIVLKCLNKNPDTRYPSMAALISDLDCFAEGKPTMARPLGPIQRVVKLANRNRALAGLVALVVLGVPTVGIVYASLYQRERAALSQAKVAIADAVTAKDLAESSESQALEATRVAEESTKLAMDMTREYLQKLAEEVGKNPAGTEERLRLHLASLEKFEKLAEVRKFDEYSRHQLSIANHFVGVSYGRLERADDSARYLLAAINLLDQLVTESPDNHRYRFDRFYNRMVMRPDGAGEGNRWEGALADISHLYEADPNNPTYADAFAEMCGLYSLLSIQTDHPEEGIHHALKGVELSTQLGQRFPEKPTYFKPARNCHCSLARLYTKLRDKEKTIRHLNEALRLHELIRQTPGLEGIWLSDEYVLRYEYQEFMVEMEDWNLVIEQTEKLFPLYPQLEHWYPNQWIRRVDRARAHLNVSLAYAYLNRQKESDEHFALGREIRANLPDIEKMSRSEIELYEKALAEAMRVRAIQFGVE